MHSGPRLQSTWHTLRSAEPYSFLSLGPFATLPPSVLLSTSARLPRACGAPCCCRARVALRSSARASLRCAANRQTRPVIRAPLRGRAIALSIYKRSPIGKGDREAAGWTRKSSSRCTAKRRRREILRSSGSENPPALPRTFGISDFCAREPLFFSPDALGGFARARSTIGRGSRDRDAFTTRRPVTRDYFSRERVFRGLASFFLRFFGERRGGGALPRVSRIIIYTAMVIPAARLSQRVYLLALTAARCRSNCAYNRASRRYAISSLRISRLSSGEP